MPEESNADRLVQLNVQVPYRVRQALRERYIETGEGQSAFARRAITRQLEEDARQGDGKSIPDLLKAVLRLSAEEQAILDEHIASYNMTMGELVGSLESSDLPAARGIAAKLEGYAASDGEEDEA